MSPSLSTIPSELICRVFQFADDFSTVAALAKTAHIFYHTWRENPTSICQAIAPRVFSNVSDAEQLLDVQEEAEAANESQDSSEQKSIIRAKRLLSNARCASAASDSWVDLIQIHKSYIRRGEDQYMRPSELARFEHAFYCVWTIGIMGTTPHLRDRASAYLSERSPRELCSLDELGIWASNYNENNFQSLGLDFDDEFWRVGCRLVSKYWQAYLHGRQDGPGIAAPHEAPLGFWAFFDETQRYLDLLEEK